MIFCIGVSATLALPVVWRQRAQRKLVSVRALLVNRVLAGSSDPQANDLNRLNASLHGLAFCSGKPGAHEASDHVAIEPIDTHKQCLGSAPREAYWR
jgi:hypothetical protein